MWWLCESSVLTCIHMGRIVSQAAERWISVSGAPVLVETDVLGRPVVACPNVSTNTKPCTSTMPPLAGPSLFVRVGGRRVLTSSLTGLTDGVPPGTYRVLQPVQSLVRVDR
jgi:hypothetical protein